MTRRKAHATRSAVLILLLMLGTTCASADTTFTSHLNATNATGAGTGAGDWGTVTVTWTNSTHASVLFSAASGFLFGDGDTVDLNVNATTFTVGLPPVITQLSGFGAPNAYTQGSGQVDGLGNFNLTLKTTSGYSEAVKTISFTLTNTSSTWADAAAVLTNNADGYDAAAHIFVCAVVGANTCSASGTSPNTFFVGENDGGHITSVPEPASIALLGGIVLFTARTLGRRRRLA